MPRPQEVIQCVFICLRKQPLQAGLLDQVKPGTHAGDRIKVGGDQAFAEGVDGADGGVFQVA